MAVKELNTNLTNCYLIMLMIIILQRIENNEKQLKELQQTCKDLIVRTEIHTDEEKLDDNETIVETIM